MNLTRASAALVGLLFGAFVSAQAPDAPAMTMVKLPQAFADTYGAKCLDGTVPVYFVTLQDPSRWILFMEGGGWCFANSPTGTISSCAGRATGGGGSSAPYNGQMGSVGGMLSANATTNPYLANYSMVFMHYCDGSSGSSAATDPIPVPSEVRAAIDANPPAGAFQAAPTQIWMRGRANLVATINYLLEQGGMGAATDVILTGGSAGATAAYYGADVVRSLLPPSTMLTVAPDAGFFQDYNASSAGQNYRASFVGADPVWNSTASGGLNEKCLAAYPGNASWHCFFQAYAAPFISVPVFIFNAAYDAWQVGNDLGLPCVPCSAAPCPSNTCDAAQLEIFQAYRTSQLQSVSATLAVPGNGAWVASCYVHEMNVDYCDNQNMPNCIGWSPFAKYHAGPYKIATSTGSLSMAEAFQNWHAAVTADYPATMARRAAYFAAREAAGDAWVAPATGGPNQVIDQVAFPNNPTCPYPTPSPAPAVATF